MSIAKRRAQAGVLKSEGVISTVYISPYACAPLAACAVVVEEQTLTDDARKNLDWRCIGC